MSLRFTRRLFFAAGAIVIHSLVGSSLVQAQTNGGFESGFLGFETIGNATIQGEAFAPTQGSNLALLTTDNLFDGGFPASSFEVGEFLGADFSFDNFTEGSALSFDVSASTGSSLTFDFNFLTNEVIDNTFFNDSAFLTVNGEVVSTLADTSTDSVPSDPANFTPLVERLVLAISSLFSRITVQSILELPSLIIVTRYSVPVSRLTTYRLPLRHQI